MFQHCVQGGAVVVGDINNTWPGQMQHPVRPGEEVADAVYLLSNKSKTRALLDGDEMWQMFTQSLGTRAGVTRQPGTVIIIWRFYK